MPNKIAKYLPSYDKILLFYGGFVASLDIKEYSSLLHECIESAKAVDNIPLEVSDEIQGFLRNRPLVLLKNADATVCYLRPGIQKEIQALFVKRGQPIDMPEEPLLDSAIHDFSDLSNPPLCSKNKEDLKLLYDTCEKVGLLRELYIEVISHDTDYFQQFLTERPAPIVGFTPLGIGECACIGHKSNRVFNNMRYVYEEQFVNHILAVVPNKSDTVRVLSMGSGRLLQDWKLIGLLIKEGYTTFQWVLVDPINSNNPRIDRLKDFYEKIKDIHVELIACTSIAEVQDKAGVVSNQHAVLTIDFDQEILKDLSCCKVYLHPAGKLFLSSGVAGFVVTAQETASVFQEARFLAMANDIEASVPDNYQGVVRIACIENWAVAVYAISVLQRRGAAVVELHIDMDANEEKISAQELFGFFFPTLHLTIKTPTTDEIEDQIEQKQQFDFILSYPLTKEELESMGVASFEQVDSHIMTKTNTAYILGPSALTTFRWK